jgi:hypothetical protein
MTCNVLASRVTDYGWHIAGRDQYGNVVYFRRLVDSNGNVIFEQARRNDFGRYLVTNTHTMRRGTVYGPNGEICKYSSNDKGYKEDCKYARVTGVDYRAPKYKPAKYKPIKYEPIRYKPLRYEPLKYHAPKVIHYDNHFKGPKPHDEKGKGPKH